MYLLSPKISKRLSIIVTNSLSSIAVPAVNAVFSLLVVRLSGADVWGEFIYYFLWASLGSVVMNWGNKEYLLKEFSRQPARISFLWRESFFTRSLLIVPSIIVFIISFPLPPVMLLVQWTLLLFLTQSFEALTVYRRKFIQAFIIELIAGALLCSSVIFNTGFSLFTKYLLYLCTRAVLYFILFRSHVFGGFNIRVNFALLKSSSLFFLLGITGLIGSRIDQYCVSLMLPKEELGKYNILKSYLLYFQAVSGFIIMPFVKDIYRMRDDTVKILDKRQFLWGIMLTPLYITILYITMNFFYGFSFSLDIYIYSTLFIPPVYFYSVKVYKMIKEHNTAAIIWITSVAICISAVLNILLIPILKIEGGLIASITAGIFSAVLYYFYNRRKITA